MLDPGHGPTKDEEHLHSDVADDGAAGSREAVLCACEADVVGDGDGHVEGGQQDEPVPEGLEDAVVEQDEAGLLHRGHFVLGDGRLVLKHVLGEQAAGRHTDGTRAVPHEGVEATGSLLSPTSLGAMDTHFQQGTWAALRSPSETGTECPITAHKLTLR